MIIRKLEQNEHGKTRELWEQVFPEDTKEFLDYYYFVKARDNQIYVIEEEGEIRSMLQLNPYEIRIENRVFPSFYIIAVATQKEYRGRGYMGALLRECMQEMYSKKVPFTFLMPAAEAIYLPYDFRYIYNQAVGKIEKDETAEKQKNILRENDVLPGEKRTDCQKEKLECTDAMLWDAEQMADFFKENFEGKWQVYAERSSEYYRTMILEQQSEQGGVRLIKSGETITGMFAYAGEGAPEVREPLFLQGYEEEIVRQIRLLQKDSGKPVRVYAAPPSVRTDFRPVIMARIICLKQFLPALTVPEEMEMACSFAVIDPLVTQNSRIWKLYSGPDEQEIHVCETEDSEGVLPVAELTDLLFGRTPIEEIEKRPDVILTEHLKEELEKIVKLERVFFNEIV